MSTELRDAEARRLAACQRGEDILVSASAGTGKTRLLVDRVIHLITDPVARVDVDRLLVVTFTDAAAAEMRTRILERLLAMSMADPADQWLARQVNLMPRAQISTVHSFCLALVRQQFHQLGLDPGMEVMNEQEADLLCQEVLDELCEKRYVAANAGFLALIDAYGGDRSDEPVRSLALSLLSFVRGQPDPGAWLRYWTDQLAAAGEPDPADLPWLPGLAAIVAAEFDRAAWLLGEAESHCTIPDGPSAYLSVIAAERADVTATAAAVRAANARQGRPDWEVLQRLAAAPERHKRLPGARGVDEAARKAPQELRHQAWEAIGRARSLLGQRSIVDLAADLRTTVVPVRALVDLVLELDAVARERRATAGQLDFADFEHYAVRLLCAPVDGGVAPLDSLPLRSAFAIGLREHYAAVLVDEYQDINPAQELIIRMVADRNLFTVGDVKQSIYRFRGTDPAGFVRLMRSYAPPSPAGPVPGARGVHLTLRSNFRSRQSILAAANYIFAQLMTPDAAEIDYDEQAMLVQGTTEYLDAPDVDAPVELYLIERQGRVAVPDEPGPDDEADDQAKAQVDTDQPAAQGMATAAELDETEREADLIGRRILAMVGGGPGGEAEFAVYDRGRQCHRPVEFGDIAILMRAVQGRANRYLERLAAMGIPVRAELSTGYFAAIEVETVLSLLQVIDNPRQDIPLAAVLRSPIVGLDEVQLAEVRLADRTVSFHDAVLIRAASDDQLGERLRAFLARADTWRTAARRAPLSDLVWQLLESTGYLSFVAGLPGGRQRQANLVALHERARQFDRFSRQGLARFLRFIERLHTAKHDLGAISDPGLGLNCVFLTSIHKAKGLEFPVVFLPDLGKQFHQGDKRDILWHRELGLGPRLAVRAQGAKYPTVAWQAIEHRLAAESLAEEMRVLYVAMTRARERLVLTGSVPDLNAAAIRWAASVVGESRLPAPVVARDRTYIDWICRSLARHPDVAQVLLASQSGPCVVDAPVPVLGSRWQVTCLPRVTAGAARATASAPSGVIDRERSRAILDRAMRLEPLMQPPPDLAAFLAARYGWSYEHAWRAGLPAKVSVSELRRLDDLVEAGEAGRVASLPIAADASPPEPDATWALPRLDEWGGQRQRITAAYRGTLVHQILGKMRLEAGLDRAALTRIIDEMVARRLLASEAAALGGAEISGLIWFLSTGLGARLAAAGSDIARELPFTLVVSATRIKDLTLPGRDGAGDAAGLPAAARDEVVLVQGIIDCLLWGPDGAELIEYKTDRLAPAEAATAVSRYRVQLGLYAEAIEAAFGRPVVRAHLVLLSSQTIVSVERALLRI